MLSNLFYINKYEKLRGKIDVLVYLSSFPALYISHQKANAALVRKIYDTVIKCALPTNH